MNRNDIIEEVVKSGIVEKVSSRFWSYINNNRKDFIQYIYLLLCELPEAKLTQLYSDKQLDYYIISIIRNQAVCTYNPFHKQFSDPNIDYMSDTQLVVKYDDLQ